MMIVILFIVMAIVMSLSFADFSDPSSWHPRWRSRRSHSGGQGQAESHLEETVPEKQGFFSKVKDSLNFPKHVGFVSDLDSPAAQAAIAEAREREEREGPTEVVPQAPLSERVKDGVNSVAATATEVATGVSGGVHPVKEEPPEQAGSVTEEALPDGTLGHPEGDIAGAGAKKQDDVSDASVPKDSDLHKHSLAHGSGQKEANPKTEKEGHSFYKRALHTAHKFGNVVASKDLSEKLLSEKTSKK